MVLKLYYKMKIIIMFDSFQIWNLFEVRFSGNRTIKHRFRFEAKEREREYLLYAFYLIVYFETYYNRKLENNIIYVTSLYL